MSKALKLVRELAVWLPEKKCVPAEGTASMLEWSETVKAADETKQKTGSLTIYSLGFYSEQKKKSSVEF